MNDLSSKVKRSLLSGGASLVGFADIRKSPPGVRSHMNYAISIAVVLDASVIAKINTGPTREYYS